MWRQVLITNWVNDENDDYAHMHKSEMNANEYHSSYPRESSMDTPASIGETGSHPGNSQSQNAQRRDSASSYTAGQFSSTLRELSKVLWRNYARLVVPHGDRPASAVKTATRTTCKSTGARGGGGDGVGGAESAAFSNNLSPPIKCGAEPSSRG